MKTRNSSKASSDDIIEPPLDEKIIVTRIKWLKKQLKKLHNINNVANDKLWKMAMLNEEYEPQLLTTVQNNAEKITRLTNSLNLYEKWRLTE